MCRNGNKQYASQCFCIPQKVIFNLRNQATFNLPNDIIDLRQRTKEGIETGRLNGSQIGHPVGTKLVVKKAVEAKKVIQQHSKDFDGSLDDKMCMKLTGVSRNSFYKYKKELKAELCG